MLSRASGTDCGGGCGKADCQSCGTSHGRRISCQAVATSVGALSGRGPSTGSSRMSSLKSSDAECGLRERMKVRAMNKDRRIKTSRTNIQTWQNRQTMTAEHRRKTDRQTDKGRQADRQTNRQPKHAETHIKDKVLFDTADGVVDLAFQSCFVVHLMLLQHRPTDV